MAMAYHQKLTHIVNKEIKLLLPKDLQWLFLVVEKSILVKYYNTIYFYFY